MKKERIVIVGYKPLPEKEDQLLKLLKNHTEILRHENLVSERKPVVLKAENGTLVEIFEWKSKEAIEAAHSNPAVQNLWAEFQKVCEYVPVGELDESKMLFSEFVPVN